LITYVGCVKGVTIDDMILCKPMKRRVTAKEFFKIVGFTKWSDCVGVCTDAARIMTGNKDLQTL
jgi:hypothetical protein